MCSYSENIHTMYIIYLKCISLPPAGEEAAVPVLHQREGEGVADGVTDSLHQSDRGAAWQRVPAGGAEERCCESSS